jgi:hypothetical protein
VTRAEVFRKILSESTWCEEGTAARTGVRKYPVRHLLVNGWLWCSGGPGRPDNNPQSNRYCSECITLARDYLKEYVDA